MIGLPTGKTKFLIHLVLPVFLIILLPVTAWAAEFAGGDGTAGNPYQIATPEQLNTVRETVYLDRHFILVDDIDLSESVWGSVYGGAGWVPIGTEATPFTGDFDGNGNTISNLYINRSDTDGVGLFGCIFDTAIQNVELADVKVTGKSYVGGLAGLNAGATITGSYTTGTSSVEGTDNVGGLVGVLASFNDIKAAITNSHATGFVAGSNYVGGLVGQNGGGTITNSHATAAVEGNYYVGGLAGILASFNDIKAAITNSYATGTVAGTKAVGGLVGHSTGDAIIDTSHATGSVTGTDYTGGLVGINDLGAAITDSYVTGSVTGRDYVGGLVGRNVLDVTITNPHAITNSHATGTVAGINAVGGLVGHSAGDAIIDTSHATGSVTGTNYYAGGLVGGSEGSDITNSYATGTVNGGDYVGGLVGGLVSFNDFNATITSSYATGSVSGTSCVGGLVGENDGGTVTDSYYNSQTTGQENGVGAGDANGVTGLTTTVMKQQNSFTGWDFDTVWEIAVGTYPYLDWQGDNQDFAPPVFADGYPQAENVTDDTADLRVWVDEDATAYFVVLPGGADAPTAAQIKAGTDRNGESLAENRKGNIVLTAGTVRTVTITGYDPETTYDIYVTAEDTAYNLQPDVLAAMVRVTTSAGRRSGGGGGGGRSTAPADSASKFINADTGGSVSFGNATVEVPGGTLPDDATLKVERLSEREAEDLIPSGLGVKLGSDIYEITTTGDRDFGDNTITIKIAYDSDQIGDGEEPVIHYYDEETGEWTALETTVEQDADGKWYAVVEVNHLTKFTVFSAEVEWEEAVAHAQKVIVLTLDQKTATVDGSPYTLDAAPYIDMAANRTLVPIRFVSEALKASVDWNTETRQVIIKDGEKEIVLTIGSSDVLVNGEKQTIDSAPAVLPPGRTFVPLRFVSENLGAQVDWNSATQGITITR